MKRGRWIHASSPVRETEGGGRHLSRDSVTLTTELGPTGPLAQICA